MKGWKKEKEIRKEGGEITRERLCRGREIGKESKGKDQRWIDEKDKEQMKGEKKVRGKREGENSDKERNSKLG